VAVAVLLAACGGEASSDANQPSGTYDVRVADASFPTEQRLGQTSLLELTVRNTGKKTLPTLAVTVSIAGKEGQDSSLPFGIRDPQSGLAQPDRPVWVLAAGYPRLPDSSGRFTVLYKIAAGLSENAKAESNGVAAGGSFATDITAALPDTEVTDSGEVVEKAKQRQRAQPGE
jgi:hypothetical protein